MLPSSTVENYLKAIYLGTSQRPDGDRLPMGHLATALGVVPGTATTMVKALAESGLVDYEPYNGVRLSAAGLTLAALVLRRHRLIELFLVRVMGLGWDEVHDEAEHLEHVVSDRLIARIDEMLGFPQVDPHGDPIPNAAGEFPVHESSTLLTCDTGTMVTVTRITDQEAGFLRFVQQHGLMPGHAVDVVTRDEAADAVSLSGPDGQRLTIGTRAASKVRVSASQASSRA